MTDREQQLRAMICASPHDDSPRLILADWLEERGECDRAGFIRDSIRYRNHSSQPATAANLRAWQASEFHLPLTGTYHVQWAGGFIEQVECTWIDFAMYSKRMRELQPIKRVDLTTWPEVVVRYQDEGTRLVSVLAPNGVKEYKSAAGGIIRTDSPAIIEIMLKAEWPDLEFTLPRTARNPFTRDAVGAIGAPPIPAVILPRGVLISDLDTTLTAGPPQNPGLSPDPY